MGAVQIMPPERRNAIAEAANAERERIRHEGREEGVKIGRQHAEHIRAVAYLAIGFIAGGASMGVYFTAQAQQAQITVSAIVDRVLQRTIDAPTPPRPPAELSTRDASAAQLEAENRTGSCSLDIPAKQRPPHCFRTGR
jgi:hypothetical protein